MKIHHYQAMTMIHDRRETARLLPFPELVETLRGTMLDYRQGAIVCPERLVVPLRDGDVMLSMPATAPDIAIHKLVNICPSNAKRGLPTIHGFVNAFDIHSGVPLFSLDGPTVTGRRTAAVSMLGILTLHGRAPTGIAMIGTGAQAANHVQAIAAVFPGVRVWIKGRNAAQAASFCEENALAQIDLLPIGGGEIPEEADVVLTATTSKAPVYAHAPAAGRLLIGVGAFTPDAAEVAPGVVLGSTVYVDDPLGARHEAGDLIQAGADWSRVLPLADAIASGRVADGPLFFKSVGCAAWDLAACRVAQAMLARS